MDFAHASISVLNGRMYNPEGTKSAKETVGQRSVWIFRLELPVKV